MSKPLFVLNGVLAAVYFIGILTVFPVGNRYLFWIFIVGEVFHLWQLFTYLYTVWDVDFERPFQADFFPPVDVFITVATEPVEMVEETVRACLAMSYPDHRVFILNDGYVAGSEHWRDMEQLAMSLGIQCITRRVSGGAKAGNINHALRLTESPYVVIFDADHVPHQDFLLKTMGYFADPDMGFIQTPQYYKNHLMNPVAAGSWEQQELFFGPIMKGKNRLNAVFMCGTNMVVRRQALVEAGGMCETNIAEDFLTSLFIHEKGWSSYYLAEVLAEGLAPEDFLSYYKQQSRWARGSLEIIFKYNPLFRGGLTFKQKLQYLTSASFYLCGPITLMNAFLPIIFFFTGQVVFNISTMALASVFLPYILLTLYTLYYSSNYSFTFRAIAFSMGAFMIHTKALAAALLGLRSSFQITSKTKLRGNFLYLTTPHILYILLATAGAVFAVYRNGFTDAIFTNIAWGALNIAIFLPFVEAALPPSSSPVFYENLYYFLFPRRIGEREGAGDSYYDERL